MATRQPLVIDLATGRTRQQPTTDTLNAGAAVKVTGYMEITAAAAPAAPGAGVWRLYVDSTTGRVTLFNSSSQAFTVRQRRVVILADTTPIATDAATGDIFELDTLSQDTTINNPSNVTFDGQTVEYRIKSTAKRTLVWGGNFRGSSDVPLPTKTTGSSKIDRFAFEYHLTDGKLDCVAVNKGF